MNFQNFNKNLKMYQPYEIKAAELIQKIKNVKISKYCINNKYDFKTNDNIKYEVKAEPMSLKTNNYFIEYMGYGKASGITTTKANFYIFTDTHDNFYLISVEHLKIIIEKHGIKKTTADRLTFGYIVKCNYINDEAEKLIII